MGPGKLEEDLVHYIDGRVDVNRTVFYPRSLMVIYVSRIENGTLP